MLNLDINENTVLYLKGDSFVDSSFYKNSIVNNGITINENGKFGECYDFTSIDGSMCTSSGVKLPQDVFTIEWWEKNTTNTSTKTSAFVNNIGNATSGSNSFAIGKATGSNNPKIWLSSNGTSWDIAQTVDIGNPCLNKWVHRAVIYNGIDINCYEDGKLFKTISLNGKTLHILDSELIFKSLRGTTSSYCAYIDEFKIHNTVKWDSDFTPPLSQYAKVEDLEVNATLFDTVNRIKAINELKQEEKTLLKNNLTEKGVECSDNDTMLSLINKVGDVLINEKISLDTTKTNFLIDDKSTSLPTTFSHKNNYIPLYSYTVLFEGDIYFQYQVKVAQNEYWVYYTYIEVVNKEGEKIYTETHYTIPESNTLQTRLIELNGLKSGDIINVYSYGSRDGVRSETVIPSTGNYKVIGIIK